MPALAADLCRTAEPGTQPPPGAVLGIAIGDRQQVVAYGDAVRLPGRVEPFTDRTRTDAGSVTKIIATTASIMALVDSRRLALDDLVGPIVGRTLPAPITVGDLLEHQAGLWEWWPLYLRARDHDQALDLISSLPARYPRRAGRHYSDLGFMLLGAVVEKVTDLVLDKASQELVFGPYGLDHTSFGTPVPGAPVAASSSGDRIERTMIDTGVPYPVDGSVDDFAGWRQHTLIGEINDGNSFHAFGSVAGHAGVFTTAGDLLRFGRGLLDSLAGSGPASSATAARFLTPGQDPGQALGLRHWTTPAGPAIGHTGFPGVGFAVLPTQDAVIVMVTNRLHAERPARNLETLWLSVLDGLVGQEPAAPDPGTSGPP
ncbi:esterase [Microlunatus endophyticus]|uniref:Esterase n=1 Tax=Microlunatus endophyticus TaxID=1716077 RepID=A0A917S6I2_9ACTN|nr:serine hydrolase domain-containing protein [Microlunatus endophyticus]GGL57012.1 esterase [Microlunatus endophyticus]